MGRQRDHTMICSTCYGTGRYFNKILQVSVVCIDCWGRGTVSCCEGNPNGKEVDRTGKREDGEEGDGGLSSSRDKDPEGRENSNGNIGGEET